MDEENPLHIIIPKKNLSTFNKSGRPKNENLIKFSPQPQSHISQMLKKIKKAKSDSLVLECRDFDTNARLKDFNDDRTLEDINDVAEESTIELEHVVKDKFEEPNKSNFGKNVVYPCDYPDCSYVSKLSSNLIKHKRTHTMERPYLCDKCSFRSNFVNSLKVHKRIHTNERPYSCNHCSYRCNSSSNLKKHCKHRHWDVI